MGGSGPNRPKQNMHVRRAQRGGKERHPKEHADISNTNNWPPEKRTRKHHKNKSVEISTQKPHMEQKITRGRKEKQNNKWNIVQPKKGSGSGKNNRSK